MSELQHFERKVTDGQVDYVSTDGRARLIVTASGLYPRGSWQLVAGEAARETRKLFQSALDDQLAIQRGATVKELEESATPAEVAAAHAEPPTPETSHVSSAKSRPDRVERVAGGEVKP